MTTNQNTQLNVEDGDEEYDWLPEYDPHEDIRALAGCLRLGADYITEDGYDSLKELRAKVAAIADVCDELREAVELLE